MPIHALTPRNPLSTSLLPGRRASRQNAMLPPPPFPPWPRSSAPGHAAGDRGSRALDKTRSFRPSLLLYPLAMRSSLADTHSIPSPLPLARRTRSAPGPERPTPPRGGRLGATADNFVSPPPAPKQRRFVENVALVSTTRALRSLAVARRALSARLGSVERPAVARPREGGHPSSSPLLRLPFPLPSFESSWSPIHTLFSLFAL